MNIKCLFNKHDYVPIQYVDETTDYEWTYIVHCSRCHKESVHDMGEKDKEIKWNLIPSSNGTEAYEQIDFYYVADFADDFVLYMGTLENCNQVMEQNYAGLQVIAYENLTYQMKLQLHNDFN